MRGLLAVGILAATICVAPPVGAGGAPRPHPVVDPGDGGRYVPVVDPAQFVEQIDNPYLPLVPGSRWVYVGRSGGRVERDVVEVLDERRTVMGISAVVVRDTVTSGGRLVEDTRDWFAQDRAGNVWYLGEAVQGYRGGKPAGHGGSWEAGVGGALPGIVMPAVPQVGDAFRQEYSAGEAEDMFEVRGLGARVTVPFGVVADVVVTTDWSPLEPEVIERKWYAPGIGVVREKAVAGGVELAELVRFTRG